MIHNSADTVRVPILLLFTWSCVVDSSVEALLEGCKVPNIDLETMRAIAISEYVCLVFSSGET